MLYADYMFQIDENGLLMYNKGNDSVLDMVQIDKTPLNVGDTFVLELDEFNRMFFRRVDIREAIFDDDYEEHIGL
jgi:hypothetical protein